MYISKTKDDLKPTPSFQVPGIRVAGATVAMGDLIVGLFPACNNIFFMRMRCAVHEAHLLKVRASPCALVCVRLKTLFIFLRDGMAMLRKTLLICILCFFCR